MNSTARTVETLRLVGAGLIVDLCQDGEVRFLDVRGRLQAFLLPLPTGPEVRGLSLPSPVSRLHALPWAFAYGSGPVPEIVRFETESLRFRQSTGVTPQPLGEHAWVAVAEGLYTVAEVVPSETRFRLVERF